MNKRFTQRGVTLTEMIVVIAGIAIFTSLTIPTVRVFQQSVESPGAARSMISGALASARAIAAKEQHYAGIRFQIRPDNPSAADPLNPHTGSQYMVFIIHDFEGTGNIDNGFLAVEGLKPIKLPKSLGVMTDIDLNTIIADEDATRNATTFSVVFSPSGRLLIHDVRVSNRGAADDIFNTQTQVSAGNAMFYQDVTSTVPGLDKESSLSSFVLFDRKAFKQAYEKAGPYNGFLEQINMNPYTGTMILRD